MEHLIAKGVDRALQFLHSRRIEAHKGEGAPFVTDENTRRFSALASMIAGRDLEVASIRGDTPPRPYWNVLYRMAHPALLPEHGFGWSDGEKLFFPVSIVEMPDEASREGLARALLFFLSFQARCGSLDAAHKHRALLSSDHLVSDLYWIIENTRLYGLIKAEYPGVLRNWHALAGALLGKRPPSRLLNRAEEKVEGFLRESVEGTFLKEGGTQAVSRSSDDSLRLALMLKDRWTTEGIALKKYRAIIPFSPWGKLIPERIKSGEAITAGKRADTGQVTAASLASGEPPEKKQGKAGRYAAKKKDVDEKANEGGLALNIYDKVLSWAEFLNVRRPFDDDPDEGAGKKADECEELSMADLERRTKNTFDASLEKSDQYDGVDDADEMEAGSFYYPEWDYKKRAYRVDYSRLVETAHEGSDTGFCARVIREKVGVIKEVTRNLELLSPSLRLVGRRSDGSTIDIGAAVDAMADLEAGVTPDERFYAEHVRAERDVCALFLVDLSMSTDGWAGTGKIIDHEKESLIVLCEALKKLRDRYAIYGFSGKGRKGCRFFSVKSFTEQYGEKVKERISGLIPHSYTRMGPAIRHAVSLLGRQSERTRLLFIISDGKPNDIDVYEGRYGVEDTRMAIKEAESEGITPFCITIDTSAGDYLPGIFGRGNYAVVPGVELLARRLPELYARIIQRL